MIALLLALPLVWPSSDPATREVLTPHRVAELQMVGSASLSPDGRHVAYTLVVPRGADQEDGGAWSELHVLDVESGRRRPFITGEVSVRAVEWTPDGSGIVFLAKRGKDEFTALWRIPVDGGEARRLVALDDNISTYSLSPDGARAALIALEKKDAAVREREKKGYRQEVYEEDWRKPRVWIAALDGSDAPRALELEPAVLAVAWSPAGDQLALTVSPTPLVDDTYMKKSVWVVDVEGGAVLARHGRPGKLGQVAWSADGAWLALIGPQDIHDPREGRVLVAPALGGELVDLLPGYEGHAQAIVWRPAGDLFCLMHTGLESELLAVLPNAPGEARRVVGPGGVVLNSLSLAADGLAGVFVGSSPSHPPELFTMRHGDAGPARRTDSNPWLAEISLARQEPIRFQARDGLEIEAVLIHPLERAEGQTVPLIVYVHGGPEAHESNGWLTAYQRPGQVAAALGYAVVYPNYRGSTGRGAEFSMLGQGDFAGAEFDDLVDCVDHLVGIGLVDSARVGVTGGSYGGFATAWCSTRYSDRFAAGVMFVGISNNVSKVGTTDIPEEMYLVHQRVRLWDNWQLYLERSPIYHAGNSRTPLLILHGKDDPRVDKGQSHELHRHLKQRGQAPVRLVLYPGEGHGNRKRSSRLDYNLRMQQWFDHYLLGPGGAPPPHELDYAVPATDADGA